jgi:hypothetical protein
MINMIDISQIEITPEIQQLSAISSQLSAWKSFWCKAL